MVAFNLASFRKVAGLTQEELGRRLGGWSAASVSAAERSWDGKRIRQFDADEIVGFAEVLDVPVIAMFLPPPDAGTQVEYSFAAGSIPVPLLSASVLLVRLFPTIYLTGSPTMRAFGERVTALGASGLLALTADERAQALLGDARARAEGLERDAQERHRQSMTDLMQQRVELTGRIDELRAFERRYRIDLLAYLEEQVRALRAGAADSGNLPGEEGDTR